MTKLTQKSGNHASQNTTTFWGNRHVLLLCPHFMQRYFYTLIIAVSWCVHYYDDAADDSV